MQTTLDTKQQIIEMSDKRFRRYGFGKTTMAEIAKDCHMSAANLYRYFESKEKIGLEIALKCLHTKEQLGKAVLLREGLSASARLEVFFLEILRYTHDFCANDTHLSELVTFISKEHPDMVKRHQESLGAFVAEILAEGNRTGEFDVPDIIQSSSAVLITMLHFYYPPLVMMNGLVLEELERREKAVVALLIRGLSRR